ncbi:MAG: phosphoribosylglycinamide formyltransferase [Pseudomonadota bacterium]|nr:phosphoribosylglycinamide formyltransferase [Pseudomonadota bacterium]
MSPAPPATPGAGKVPVGVLVSGRGSNLQALLDAAADPTFPAAITMVLANVPGAYALERAAAAGIATAVVPSKGVPREDFERALLHALGPVEWVCLAGFMRVLTPTFLGAFPGRVLNIHPALLPAFPGTHGARQALEGGVVQAGATVHLVDAGVDTGPILAQGTVAVHDDDTEATLAARILTLEHRLYPMALRWAAEGRITLEGRRARVALAPGESRWIVGE